MPRGSAQKPEIPGRHEARLRPAADGRLEFQYLCGSNAPVYGSVTADAGTNKARVVGTFNVGEGSSAPLRITVTDATGATVHESTATVLDRRRLSSGPRLDQAVTEGGAGRISESESGAACNW